MTDFFQSIAQTLGVSDVGARFALLFSITLSVLVIASISWRILAMKVTSEKGKDTVANLAARVKSWWVMIGIMACVFFFGEKANIIFFALASYMVLREVITLTPTRPGDHAALVAAFFVILPFQYWLVWTHWYGLFSIFIPVYAFMALPVLSTIYGDTSDFINRTAKIQWAVMIAVYCLSHVPAFFMLEIDGHKNYGPLLVCFLLGVVQISDVLQYVFGKIFGKHKIAPSVSPSKTVEGLIGGGLSASLVGASLWWLTPFSPLVAGGMALAIVCAGFLGGLVLSAVKRSLGAKDWGTLIEGHGGMLDRMDSVSFAAPLFFHLVRYFYT